ncbi:MULTISPECIES: SpaA isopeptide-forming pilin-related protein [Helcococcus]|uniref:SpaA isopeptide-forming pilin-related protein n=1 Tax=Helcococcus bovis TaxID=3153252 RepID=A0ABW9F613_9FIRM
MKKRILSEFLAFIMVFAMVLGFYTPMNPKATEATSHTTDVVIHKIVMPASDLASHTDEGKDPKYVGNQITEIDKYFTNGKEVAGVAFKVYKLDVNGKVTGDTLKSGEPAKDKYTLVKNGGKDFFITEASGVKVSGLADGTYIITEDKENTTYKADGNQLAAAKAIPTKLVLPQAKNDGTGYFGTGSAALHIYPKNTEEKPKIDKNFMKDNNFTEAEVQAAVNSGKVDAKAGADYNNYALEKSTVNAQIGREIPYQVKTEIPKDAKYENLAWNDVMTKGLTFNQDSLVIKMNDIALDSQYYEVVKDSQGFKLSLTKQGLDYLKTEAAKAAVTFELNYSATVNGDTIVDKPETNNISLDYSNKPGKSSIPTEVKPRNKEITVIKTWASDGQDITKADETVSAAFTLQVQNDDGRWSNVETYVATSNEKFTHTFKNLDDDKNYRVIERVSGYKPEYVTEQPDGTVKIVNNKDNENPTPLNPTEPKVVTYGKKFVKTSQTDTERLAGAEFLVKNASGHYLARKSDAASRTENDLVVSTKKLLDAAVKAYNERKNDINIDTLKANIDKAQADYNAAVVAANNAFEWVQDKADANIVKLVSDSQGRFEITGLGAGTYYLEETKAPDGYALPTNTFEFTVGEGTYAGIDTEIQYNKDNADNGYGQQVKNNKVTIPQTGGIGTIIFTVAGLIIMGGAIYALKKNNQEVEA